MSRVCGASTRRSIARTFAHSLQAEYVLQCLGHLYHPYAVQMMAAGTAARSSRCRGS